MIEPGLTNAMLPLFILFEILMPVAFGLANDIAVKLPLVGPGELICPLILILLEANLYIIVILAKKSYYRNKIVILVI